MLNDHAERIELPMHVFPSWAVHAIRSLMQQGWSAPSANRVIAQLVDWSDDLVMLP